MNLINDLLQEMICYYTGDAKRIQHFIKVHSFSKLIGELEHLDSDTLMILELASIVHDIGIKPAEEKYGSCNGKFQEQEGPSAARELLQKLHVNETAIERICYLVGHHHTYDKIDGADYQILVEADFLVNLYEDGADTKAAASAYEKIFKTETGKQLCKTMFL